MQLCDCDTPSLVLDETKLMRNIAHAKTRCAALGVQWRPHFKTHKCVEIARAQVSSASGPGTVSTVKEAEEFCAAGITDLIYAVGIAPHKLARINRLNAQGADVKIVLDNVETARAVSAFCLKEKTHFGVLIEIDCDGHRSGLKPDDVEMVRVAQALTNGAECLGVLTHAGESYSAKSEVQIVNAARQEVAGANTAAALLRTHGFPISIVSVGSTPTLCCAKEAQGVTEYRSGVGTFFDLVMRGLGVCSVDDIAVSVLVRVIGHQKAKGWVITDGGWLAMSRDRGTAAQKCDCGYGLVCDVHGRLIPELWMSGANQEHGIVSRRDGGPVDWTRYGIDTPLRILPNHACPCAAAFDRYTLVAGAQAPNPDEVKAFWPRFNYWD